MQTKVQEALARAFEQELELFDSKPENSYLLKIMADDLLLKRDRMAKLLQSVGIKPVIPDAGYFMMADYTGLG